MQIKLTDEEIEKIISIWIQRDVLGTCGNLTHHSVSTKLTIDGGIVHSKSSITNLDKSVDISEIDKVV